MFFSFKKKDKSPYVFVLTADDDMTFMIDVRDISYVNRYKNEINFAFRSGLEKDVTFVDYSNNPNEGMAKNLMSMIRKSILSLV